MRELTFKGFLKQYVRALSHQNTNNIYKLVRETAENNPRLYEPLFLYANFADKSEEFYSAVKCTPGFNSDKLPSVKMIENFDDLHALPPEYTKVYNTYLYQKNKAKNDSHTKQLMCEKIKHLKKSKNITNYRIYTDLSLNPGNFNSFIKHGDVSKYSLDTLRLVITYLENQ